MKYLYAYIVSVIVSYLSMRLFRKVNPKSDFWTSHPQWAYDALILIPVLNIFLAVGTIKSIIIRSIRNLFKKKK